MSTKNFLDKAGVIYYLVKIKNFLSSTYVAKDGDKVLSTNDFTNAEKGKLEGITAGATKTEIDDTSVSDTKVWSSRKIDTQISGKQNTLTPGTRISINPSTNTISAESEIDDSSSANNTTYSSSKIDEIINGFTDIDDTETSSNSTWSSNKIDSELDNKQDVLSAGSRISFSGNTISADSEIDDTANTSTNTWSASKINAVIAALNKLSLAIVQTLPTEDISTTTIYLVPKSTLQTNNVYDEYVYINSSWEAIGSTEIDMSGYVRESDLVAITNSEIDAMFD